MKIIYLIVTLLMVLVIISGCGAGTQLSDDDSQQRDNQELQKTENDISNTDELDKALEDLEIIDQ